MQTLKFIGAGIFALFALRVGFKAMRFVLVLLSGSGNAMTFSGLLAGFAGVILWGLLSYACWKSATKTRQTAETLSPPLPEVPQDAR